MEQGQKEFAIGNSKFLIRNYDCDKWITMLAKLTKLLSKPAMILFKDGLNAKDGEAKLAEAIGSIFETAKPEELPGLLNEITAEVDWKSTGGWTNLNEVRDHVFLTNKADRLTVCKEVLMHNYQKEIGRFFGSLPSIQGLVMEAQKSQAPSTSSPNEIKIKAR